MKTSLAIVLILVFTQGFGQSIRDLSIELEKLRKYSVEYSRYTHVLTGSQYEDKRDQARNLYNQQIQKISQGPQSQQFEQFLINAIEQDSVSLKNVFRYNYRYVSDAFILPVSKLPTKLDYFKVVYYSLFVAKEEKLLPEDQFDFLKDKKAVPDVTILDSTEPR